MDLLTPNNSFEPLFFFFFSPALTPILLPCLFHSQYMYMEIWRYWTLNQYRICKTPVLQRKSQYMGIFCGNYNIWALLSQKPKNHMRIVEIFFHNQNSLRSNIFKVRQWAFAQSLSLARWDMGGWWGVVSARLSSGGHLCLPLPFIFNRLSPRKRPPYIFVASLSPVQFIKVFYCCKF